MACKRSKNAFGARSSQLISSRAIKCISQFHATDISYQHHGCCILYDRITREFCVCEDLFEIPDLEAGRGEGGCGRSHGGGHGHVESVVFFVVEEGHAVEPDHAVCDAAFAEAIADCFCNAYDNLEEELVLMDEVG
jgi:hypothetical protein